MYRERWTIRFAVAVLVCIQGARLNWFYIRLRKIAALHSSAPILDIEIPAKANHVTDTRLCTTIGHGEAHISTVEHLLSALAGLGVDNARIEVSGPEVPIMDGSSAPFVFLIQCAGIKEQSRAKKVLRILKRVEVTDGDKRCALYPAAGFKISYLLDYDHPLLRKRKVHGGFLASGLYP